MTKRGFSKELLRLGRGAVSLARVWHRERMELFYRVSETVTKKLSEVADSGSGRLQQNASKSTGQEALCGV
jgi:hypothetical protein